MNAKPITEKPKKTWTEFIFVGIFGLGFTVAGLCLLTFGYLLPWRNSQASQNWQKVPCEVLESRVETHKGEDSTSYSVSIRYAYEIEGQKHESTRYDFNFSNNRSRRECQKIVQGYRKQKDGTCFVDPGNPPSSVIDRDVDLEIVFLILGIIFPVAGIFFGLLILRQGKRSAVAGLKSDSSASSKSGMPQNVSVGTLTADVDDQKLDSPQRLKPSSTRIGKLIGMIFVTLFWNGILSTFLLNAFTQRWNGFTIFLFLFLTPFVLIGAAFVLGTISSFLSLFSPKVEIATTTGAVVRGQAVDVAWEINGNPNWIKRLRIAAVGTEAATYRQGTDTHTATSDFVSILVTDTTEQQDIAFGSTSVTIPADTMHTLDSGNNKIIWVLHVKADINWWPGVTEKYEFRVKP